MGNLLKLEKKRLITKTIDKPFIIEAIPLETALCQLVLNEREKANKKVAILEDSLKELVDALREQPKSEEEAALLFLQQMTQ